MGATAPALAAKEYDTMVRTENPTALTPPEPHAAPEEWIEPLSTAERTYCALQMLKRGRSIDDIAGALPNFDRRPPTRGVTAKTAEIILRSAARTLLSAVMREHRPPNLPEELWPPDRVREELRDPGLSHRTRLQRLRRWLEAVHSPR